MFDDLSYIAKILKIINPNIDISSFVPPSPQTQSQSQSEGSSQIGPKMSPQQQLKPDKSSQKSPQKNPKIGPQRGPMDIDEQCEGENVRTDMDTNIVENGRTDSHGVVSDTVPVSVSDRSTVEYSDSVGGSVPQEGEGEGSVGSSSMSVTNSGEIEAGAGEGVEAGGKTGEMGSATSATTSSARSSSAVESRESLEERSSVSDAEEVVKKAAALHRLNGIRFLRELFYLTRSLNIDRRSELYNRLLQRLGTQLYSSLHYILSFSPESDSTSSERILVSETLACIAIVCPHSLRQYILEGPIPSLPRHLSASRPSNPVTGLTLSTPALGLISIGTMGGTGVGVVSADNNNLCFLYVIIRRVVCDCDTAVIEQLGDTVKVLLDPERLVDRLDKDKFLGIFYDSYIHWLITPFVEPNKPDRHGQEPEYCEEKKEEKSSGNGTLDAGLGGRIGPGTGSLSGAGVGVGGQEKKKPKQQTLSAISTSRRFLLDIFSLCVHGHTYRMKYFIMRNSVIARTLRVLESPHRQLHVGAVKFVRTVLATKDEFYHRHIVKLDLLRPVLEALTSSAKKDNLISSAIAELVEFVRTESIRTLADYIVEKHSACFTGAHSELLERLMIRYEQGKDRDRDRNLGYEVPEETGGGFPGQNDGFSKGNGLGMSRQTPPSSRSRRISAISDSNRDKESEDSYFFSDDDDDDDNNSTDSNSSSGSVNDNVGQGSGMGLSTSGGFITAGGGFGDYERFVREGNGERASSFSDYGRDRDRDRVRENLLLDRHPGLHSGHSNLPTDPDIDDKIATSLPSSSSSSHLSTLPYQQQLQQQQQQGSWSADTPNGTTGTGVGTGTGTGNGRFDYALPGAKAGGGTGVEGVKVEGDSLSMLQCYSEDDDEVGLNTDTGVGSTARSEGFGPQNNPKRSYSPRTKILGGSGSRGSHKSGGKMNRGSRRGENKVEKTSDEDEPPPLPPLRSKFESAEDDIEPDLKGYFRRTTGIKGSKKESKIMVIGKLKCVGVDFSPENEEGDADCDSGASQSSTLPASTSSSTSAATGIAGGTGNSTGTPGISDDIMGGNSSSSDPTPGIMGGSGTGTGVGGSHLNLGDSDSVDFSFAFNTPSSVPVSTSTPNSLAEEGISDSDMDSGNESGASAATGGTGGSDIDSDFDTSERTKHYTHTHNTQRHHTHPGQSSGLAGHPGHGHGYPYSSADDSYGSSGNRKRERDRERDRDHSGGARRVRVGGHVSDVDSDSDLPSYPFYSSSSCHHDSDNGSVVRARSSMLQGASTPSPSSSSPSKAPTTTSSTSPVPTSQHTTSVERVLSADPAGRVGVTNTSFAGTADREKENEREREKERERERGAVADK